MAIKPVSFIDLDALVKENMMTRSSKIKLNKKKMIKRGYGEGNKYNFINTQ